MLRCIHRGLPAALICRRPAARTSKSRPPGAEYLRQGVAASQVEGAKPCGECSSRPFTEGRGKLLKWLVDLTGIEPVTSSMPWKRAPSCATGPLSGRTASILRSAARLVKPQTGFARIPKATLPRLESRRSPPHGRYFHRQPGTNPLSSGV